MTPVASKVVFLTSSALGALTLGATAYLVQNPHGFGSSPSLAAEPVRAPEVAVVVPEPAAAEPASVELPPVVIEGSTKPAVVAPRRADPSAEPKSYTPCSEWREMGPTYVDDGEASGVRRVRVLC